MPYQYDDGSSIGQDTMGNVFSRDIGSNVWVDEAIPAPSGYNVFSSDVQEQNRLGMGYPTNGLPWSENASTMGVTRMIDTAVKAYVSIKGSTPATFAGQNGQTYTNGQMQRGQPPGGDMGLLLIVGALFLALG